MNNVKVFSSDAELIKAAADTIVLIAREAVAKRGRFVISLSGGHTPEHLYITLSKPPYVDQMPWSHVYIFWGDERYVPADDEQNNANMARRTLLNHITIPAENIFPVQTQFSPADAAKNYEECIRRLFGNETPVFDLMLLGIGDNSHTASLFPNTEVLHEHSRLVKEVFVEEVEMYRITMTVPLINNSRNILFLVEGESKAEAVNTILNGTYKPDTYPAQLIRPVDGKLFWYLDSNAARLL